MDHVGQNGLLWQAKGSLWWKLGPPEKSGVDVCPPLTPPPPNGASGSKVLDCQDINSVTNGFTQRLSDLISSTFPVRKSNQKTTHLRPWMSNSLIISSYRKNGLYKLACETSNGIDLTNYKKYKNLYTKLVWETKNNYYYSKICHCKGNLQKNWSTINENLQKKKKFKICTS